MEQSPMEPGSEAESKAASEPANEGGDRNYSAYGTAGSIEFDPTKDLNLPDSYDEVLKRFNRLQGDKAMEALN